MTSKSALNFEGRKWLYMLNNITFTTHCYEMDYGCVSVLCRYLVRPSTVFKYWNKWLRLVLGWWSIVPTWWNASWNLNSKSQYWILMNSDHTEWSRQTHKLCDWLWFHIEIVPMSFSHTSLVCTRWPRFRAQAKTNHPSTCSVTRKNVWAGNYSAKINPQLYIFISAKSLCWPPQPDELNLPHAESKRLSTELKI